MTPEPQPPQEQPEEPQETEETVSVNPETGAPETRQERLRRLDTARKRKYRERLAREREQGLRPPPGRADPNAPPEKRGKPSPFLGVFGLDRQTGSLSTLYKRGGGGEVSYAEWLRWPRAAQDGNAFVRTGPATTYGYNPGDQEDCDRIVRLLRAEHLPTIRDLTDLQLREHLESIPGGLGLDLREPVQLHAEPTP